MERRHLQFPIFVSNYEQASGLRQAENAVRVAVPMLDADIAGLREKKVACRCEPPRVAARPNVKQCGHLWPVRCSACRLDFSGCRSSGGLMHLHLAAHLIFPQGRAQVPRPTSECEYT